MKYKSIAKITFFLLFSLAPLFASAMELEYPFGGMSENVDPGQYIRSLFIWGLGVVSALAVVGIAIGGILYIIGKVEQGKEIIFSSLFGLLLLLGSWLILYTINPQLIKLKSPTLEDINIEPAPRDTGGTQVLSGDISDFSKIGVKEGYMRDDLLSLDPALQQTLKDIPVDVTLTETTHNHGCSEGDPCVGGASCGTSAHCQGRAVDIRTSNLSNDQIEETLRYLDSQPCVQQVYYSGTSGMSQYCVSSGQKESSPSGSCLAHTDHIHYATKEGC